MNRKLSRIVDKLPEEMKSNVWILNRHFKGEPKIEDFRLEEQELGDVQDGGESITVLCKFVIISCVSELICEAEYLSVDPYQRTYMLRYPEGTPVIGTQVAKYVISQSVSINQTEFILRQSDCEQEQRISRGLVHLRTLWVAHPHSGQGPH